MKDMIEATLKGFHVLKLFTVLFLSCFTMNGQDVNMDKLTNEEYEVINAIFSSNNNQKTKIYEKTYYDKGWSNYFRTENFENIVSKVGIPTLITDEELKEILATEVLSLFRHEINISKPIKLNPSQLDKNIILKDSFDNIKDLKDGVIRISRPIILNDLATIKRTGTKESAIHIMRKHNESWKIIYTFYDWLILE